MKITKRRIVIKGKAPVAKPFKFKPGMNLAGALSKNMSV